MTEAAPDEMRAAAFEHNPYASVAFAADGVIVLANAAARALAVAAGGSPSHLRELGLDDLDLAPLLTAFNGPPPVHGEVRLRRLDGSTLDFEYSGVAELTPGVRLLTLREVTNQRRLETALRNSEELFARSFLAAPVALTVSDAESGAFTLVNEEFLRMGGYWRSDVIGRTAAELNLWQDLDERARLGVLLAKGETQAPFRTTFRRKSGVGLEAIGRLRLAEIGGAPVVITAALGV